MSSIQGVEKASLNVSPLTKLRPCVFCVCPSQLYSSPQCLLLNRGGGGGGGCRLHEALQARRGKALEVD